MDFTNPALQIRELGIVLLMSFARDHIPNKWWMKTGTRLTLKCYSPHPGILSRLSRSQESKGLEKKLVRWD